MTGGCTKLAGSAGPRLKGMPNQIWKVNHLSPLKTKLGIKSKSCGDKNLSIYF